MCKVSAPPCLQIQHSNIACWVWFVSSSLQVTSEFSVFNARVCTWRWHEKAFMRNYTNVIGDCSSPLLKVLRMAFLLYHKHDAWGQGTVPPKMRRFGCPPAPPWVPPPIWKEWLTWWLSKKSSPGLQLVTIGVMLPLGFVPRVVAKAAPCLEQQVCRSVKRKQQDRREESRRIRQNGPISTKIRHVI